MANSKYEYVRLFEDHRALLPNTWTVIRVDGRGFHKFSARHGFAKPNDARALQLMNAAAVEVVKELPDVVLAYGVSDEFSFVLRRGSGIFERRESKIVTLITSVFTGWYIYLWPSFFPTALSPPLPSFDGRAVSYPSVRNLRDYISWRQVDAHINNLYNTTFWALIQQGGMSAAEAEKELVGTLAKDKHEILWKRFGINYNDENEMCKKGSVVVREYEKPPPPLEEVQGEGEDRMTKGQKERRKKALRKGKVVVRFCDVIKDAFWQERPWILGAAVEEEQEEQEEEKEKE